jgi:hypothetical protein
MGACACDYPMKGKKQSPPGLLLASISVILLMIASSAFSQSPGSSSIVSNFNGTSIAGGDYIWFSTVFKPTTTISTTTTTDIYFQNQTISFTAGGVNYNLSVPNAQVTFSPTATSATTVYNSSTNTWVTTIPAGGNLSGNAFLSGFAFQVPAGGLAGGINPVTWSGTFSTDQSGLGLNWQWAAANYTSFSSNYSSLGVKPVDSNSLSSYKNSDHAGTPENYENYVVGGARGGGGSNYTGSYSATASDDPPIPPSGELTITTSDTSNLPTLQTRSDQTYDVSATYTVPDPSYKLYLTRTWKVRYPNNVGQATQDPNSPYRYSIPQNTFPQTNDFGNFSPLVQYGLETWTLSYGPANQSWGPIALATAQVYIYQKSGATISNALVIGANPTSLAPSYQGDAPRVKVEIDNSYPGGTTWVAFYQGGVEIASTSIPAVANSSYTASTSDQYLQRFVYVDVGNLVQGSGTYSVQVLQHTTAYEAETLAAQTFQMNPSYQINSVVGITK